MERESAVREILQSIGPLFPEDAAKARAARKEALARAAEPAANETAAAAAPVEAQMEIAAAAKPMLASQIDNPETPKTEVAEVSTLAAILQRMRPQQRPQSVRDAVPELVRPVVPDVAALRAALNIRDVEPEPAPVAETVPAFTELPAEPETAPVEAAKTEAAEDDPQVVAAEPVFAEAVEAAPLVAEAVDIAPATAAVEQVIAEPAPPVAEDIPQAVEPIAPAPTADFSEDDHDAFVAAVADAILLPVEPLMAPLAEESVPEPATSEVPVAEASRPVAEPAVEPAPGFASAPAAESATVSEAAPAPAAETAKPKFKRAKSKKDAAASREAAGFDAPPAKDPEPQEEPRPKPVTTSAEDDELIRQIRTHRADMVDVDEQLERLDQEIAAQKQEMARYVSLVEEKYARRDRLVRLRTSTQRFVEALQIKAEPIKRAPKKEKKSA